MMRTGLSVVAALAALASARCATVDLSKALEITAVLSGYYDDGVVQEGQYAGQNRLLPSVTLKVRNISTDPVAGVWLTVSFWRDGDDGERDSREVRGISTDALAPGASTDEIVVRSTVGYTSEAARADFFALSAFSDWTAKVFAKRGGRIFPLGEFRIERRLLPHQRNPNRR
jgi:hypothetical protein